MAMRSQRENLKICNKTQKKCQSEAGLDDKFVLFINLVSKCVIPPFLEKSCPARIEVLLSCVSGGGAMLLVGLGGAKGCLEGVF